MKSFKLSTCTNVLFISAVMLFTLSANSSTLILRNANYNRNSLVKGKLVSVLEGNVIFKYDDAIIRSDKVTWYRKDGRAYFTGHVRITQHEQVLNCDRMTYTRNDKKIIAKRNVDFFDKEEQMRVVAQHAVYFLDTKHLTLTKNPKMFQYDTARAETLTIVGDKMIYNDSLQLASAEKNVHILKGLLKADCEWATYDLKTDVAYLRKDPWIFYDIHELTGDSVDLFFIDKILQGVSVMRNAKGFHRDVTLRDTIYTKVTGDSIYMDISDSGTIETIWTYDNATTIYYSSVTPHLVNEGIGKVQRLNFVHGTTGTLTISGNAECVYYLEEEKESGMNEANGDDILIHFREGKAHYIKLIGGVRGTYYAEKYK